MPLSYLSVPGRGLGKSRCVRSVGREVYWTPLISTLEYLEVSIIVLTGQTHIYGPCQPLPSSTLCLSLPLLGFREFNSWDTCGNSQDTSMYVTWMSEGGGYTQAALTQGP